MPFFQTIPKTWRAAPLAEAPIHSWSCNIQNHSCKALRGQREAPGEGIAVMLLLNNEFTKK
jgi:hypothetical protein